MKSKLIALLLITITGTSFLSGCKKDGVDDLGITGKWEGVSFNEKKFDAAGTFVWESDDDYAKGEVLIEFRIGKSYTAIQDSETSKGTYSISGNRITIREELSSGGVYEDTGEFSLSDDKNTLTLISEEEEEYAGKKSKYVHTNILKRQ